MAVLLVLLAKKLGVDQISVMRDGDGSKRKLPKQWLGVAELAAAGGGIADVADCCGARQFFTQHPLRKHLADQAHAGVAVDFPAIGDGNARRLLPAVLLGKNSGIGDGGGVF